MEDNMKKLFALVLLSLTIAACEPGTNENNSNAKPSTPAASTPAPAVPPAATDPSPTVKPQLKAGDRVIFSSYAGDEISVGEEDYLLLRESDVLAVF